MAKKVTMELIAKELGVTKNTVSLALRNMPGVSERTKNQVASFPQPGFLLTKYNFISCFILLWGIY